MAGAGGTSAGFSDGEMPGGHLRLSLDVPLIENYVSLRYLWASLPVHAWLALQGGVCITLYI